MSRDYTTTRVASAGRRNYLRLRLREQAKSRRSELTPAARWLSAHELENEKAAGYPSKYPAKWNEDGSFEVTETVKAAGRSLVDYVSRPLTAKREREGHSPTARLRAARGTLSRRAARRGRSWVVVTGTGRFTNATGEVHVTGLVTRTGFGAPLLPATFTWDGTISY